MRYWWIIFLIACNNAQSQSFTSDMFGIYEGDDPLRDSWAGERRICHDETCESETIKALELYDIDALFGEKSLTAGQDLAMLLGIFDDEFGNLIRSGSAKGIASEGGQSETIEIQDGVGYAIFKAKTQAKNEYAAIFTPQIQSERRFYRNIPDIRSISLGIENRNLKAQQGDVINLSTKTIEDQYGNRPPVGMATNVILKNANDEYGYLPLITQNEKASEVLHTTNMKGLYEFKISSAFQQSENGQINVIPQNLTGIENVEAILEKSTNILIVDFNGITTSQNHSVQDAAEITVQISEKNGHIRNYTLYSLKGNVAGRFALLENAFPIKYTLSSAFGDIQGTIFESDIGYAP